MESRANKPFPDDFPGHTPGPENCNTFKLDNLCGRHGSHSSPVCNTYAFTRKIVYRLWRTVINRYTQCDLDFENDVFPALSGLTRSFKEFLKDTCLAGLWNGSLDANLIWKRSCNPNLKSEWGPVQTPTYRASSWSWASIKGLSELFFEPRYDGKPTKLAEILESTVTLASDDPYGQALDGHIRMQGYLKPAKPRKSSKTLDTPLRHEDDGEWFDDGYDADRCRWTTGASFLPILHYSAHEYHNRQWPAKIVGLILEEVIGRNLTYRRLGLFHHLHGELCDKEVQKE